MPRFFLRTLLFLLTSLACINPDAASAQAPDPDSTLSGEVMALLEESDDLINQTLYSQAAQLLSEAYELTVSYPDSNLARTVLNSLANLHYNTGQLALARRYYEELVTLDAQSQDNEALSVSLYNLAHAEASAGEFAQATGHFNQSLDISMKLEDFNGAAYTLKALGVNLHAQQELYSALPYLDQALGMFENLGDTLQVAVVKRHLGDLEVALGNPDAAIAYYEEALPVLADVDFSEAILKVYRGLSQANESRGDMRRALVFQRAYTDLLQLEMNQQNQDSTQRIQVELETRRFADDNARLELIRRRQQEELATSLKMVRMQHLIMVMGTAILGLVILMLWRAHHNARHMHRLANTDALTGLRNRRSIMEQGGVEWHRASRFKRPLCCLVFDIDHFKSINDTYGHAQGDTVLVAFAATLQSTVRPSDLVGRIGGEEFLLVASETTLPQAQALAERLREAVEKLILPGMHDRKITVSIGLSQLQDAATLEQAIQLADQALYEAKENDRNQVRVYKPQALQPRLSVARA